MPARLHEVDVVPRSPDRFRDLLDGEAWTVFAETLQRARELLSGRVVWNVNSTASGGGVAEMLRPLLSYARGADLDARWIVIEGNPDFFRVTKRIHNLLHGDPGDGGGLDAPEREIFERVAGENAGALARLASARDAVILHDPQTVGMAPHLKATGAALVWRCHVGAEVPNEHVQRGWDFLEPYLGAVDVSVFTRRSYIPAGIGAVVTNVIQPSIDPFSAKNQDMDEETAQSILGGAGLLAAGPRTPPSFMRADGSRAEVRHVAEVTSTGLPPPDAPLVVQVSRWDRLKDHEGVLRGFAAHVLDGLDVHLVLAGPAVDSVADDPEGAEVLREVTAAWRELPSTQRSRVHLSCLPMQDLEENAAIVNALQRHAAVVTQKSIQEGFGLTVAEAMWKARPVVASAVGGIQDQIDDGVTGVLLPDPRDLRSFGAAVRALLTDSERAHTMGERAREQVRRHFLVDRHAADYVRLLETTLR